MKNAAKAEIALRRVLKDENAVAFTTNFDDLGDADIDDQTSAVSTRFLDWLHSA